MKIAVLLWPIGQEGGLATRALATVRMLREAGHECDFVRLTFGRRLHNEGWKEPRIVVRPDGLRMEQWHLSIDQRHLRQTVWMLGAAYDLFIFAHACPHLSDKSPAAANWRDLYAHEDVEHVRKITYFSDPYAEKFYPHIFDVAERFEPVAIHEAALRSVEHRLPDVRLVRAPFYFETVPGPYSEKVLDVIWPHSWKGPKGIKQFLAAVPDLAAAGRTVEVYGTGRDWYSIRKHEPDRFNLLARHLHGVVAPVAIERALRRARVSIDLTGLSAKYVGCQNRATIEPMFFGCVSAVLPGMTESGRIPAEVVWTLDRKRLAEGIEELLEQPDRQTMIAEAAWTWASRTYDPAMIARELLSVAASSEGGKP